MRIVEISRHGNHRAHQRAAKRTFGAVAQHLEDFGGNFDRALYPGDRAQLHHARRIDKTIGQIHRVADIFQPAPHEAFDRHDGVLRVGILCGLRRQANLHCPTHRVVHHRRQQGCAVIIVQHHTDAVAHRRHQRIGGAEINTDGKAVLVRRSRKAGFGDLQ